MASFTVECPRMGPNSGLKLSLKSPSLGKSRAGVLPKVAAYLPSSIWKLTSDARIKCITSNASSYCDQVFEGTAMLGAAPASGNASVPAFEIIERLLTSNLCSMDPPSGFDVEIFPASSHKAVDEYMMPNAALSSANAAAQAPRKISPQAAALKDFDHSHAPNVSARLNAPQKGLNLPILPTTTIGSFPQTMALRRAPCGYKAKKISEAESAEAIKEAINKIFKFQGELDIDALVHAEPESNYVAGYLGEQFSGFASTVNGWVQSYGSRCVKPPIIYGDVSRPKPMTVFWSSSAQSMTARPRKGMLTGPVIILNWSFVRNDQPRFETFYQIALAIKDEVEDLEKAGINIIEIHEAALREGLPHMNSRQSFYSEWAVHSGEITNCSVKDATQIHTHMCYSHFNDIIHSIIDMDADVITIENSCSDEKLLSVFHEGVKYGAGIVPGVYDIHSPRIPLTEEIADGINKMLAVLEKNILGVNPDCVLKTCKYTEVKPALLNMVAAAKVLCSQLVSAK